MMVILEAFPAEWYVLPVVITTTLLTIVALLALLNIRNFLIRTHPVPQPKGYVKPGWEKVMTAFKSNFDKGWDKGSACAIYHNGELVVNVWGGFAHETVGLPWKQDTVTRIYSSAKGIAACVIAMLVDRGHVQYEEKVATYWPEFSAEGKGDVTVEELLSQQAGLYTLDETFSELDTLHQWEKIKRIMERQSPHWTPGTGHGYHVLTIGLYMDQLVRLTDPKQRSIAQFFREEIAEPFDIEFSFGLKKEENFRCAWTSIEIGALHLLPFFKIPFFNLAWSLFTDGKSPIRKLCQSSQEMISNRGVRANNPDYRMVQNPSSSGYGTAEGLAKFYGILANGGKCNGKKLLSPKTLEKIQEGLTSGEDKVYRMNVTYGRGTVLLSSPMGDTIFGTPGFGGQMTYGDTSNKLGWAFITNYCSPIAFTDDRRYVTLHKAIYETVQDLKNSDNQS